MAESGDGQDNDDSLGFSRLSVDPMASMDIVKILFNERIVDIIRVTRSATMATKRKIVLGIQGQSCLERQQEALSDVSLKAENLRREFNVFWERQKQDHSEAVKKTAALTERNLEMLEMRRQNEIAFREKTIKELEHLHQRQLERITSEVEAHYQGLRELKEQQMSYKLEAMRKQERELKRQTQKLEEVERWRKELAEENEAITKQMKELEEEKSQLSLRQNCKICMVEAVNPVVVLKCGHGLFCEGCFAACGATICPMCRQTVKKTTRVYI